MRHLHFTYPCIVLPAFQPPCINWMLDLCTIRFCIISFVLFKVIITLALFLLFNSIHRRATDT